MLSSAITYTVCAWPLRVENAKLRAEIKRQERLARAIERHQARDEERRLQHLIENVGRYDESRRVR